jgi:enoyl-CoA hydratase
MSSCRPSSPRCRPASPAHVAAAAGAWFEHDARVRLSVSDDHAPRVDLASHGGVATITLVNPARRNALSRSMLAELRAACDEVDGEDSVAVTVLRGAEGTFCSGAERGELDAAAQLLDDAEYAVGDAMYGAFQRFAALRTPTIAAVRGAAVGAGVNLMLAADLRVVAVDARIRSGFLAVGLTPGGGFFSLVGRTGGRETAAGFGLFGAELSGRRAAELGMAWEAVDDEAVEGRAAELAAGLAHDPNVARRAVQLLRGELGPPVMTLAVAAEYERATQLWAQHRRLRGASP